MRTQPQADTSVQPAPFTAGNDERQIRALIARWQRAMQEKDADGLVADYADDVVLFDLKPPFRLVGKAAYRKVWADCMPYFPEGCRPEYDGLTITVAGEMAYAHGLCRIVPPQGSDMPSMWMRVTAVYRKTVGRWLVAHDHVSIPFNPMNGKATFLVDADRAEDPEGVTECLEMPCASSQA